MYVDQYGSTTCSDCYFGPSNEIWKYNVTSSEWKFEHGLKFYTQGAPNVGSWNTPGLRSSSNVLPRSAGQVAVFDQNLAIYVFGGGSFGSQNFPDSVSGLLNNLWKLEWDACYPNAYDCMPCPPSDPQCRGCKCSFASVFDRLDSIGYPRLIFP